ncbi:hypothetical protein [Spiroplasma endosymbiont of Danaus chrysippus]|uniref:hypothetical protein n=1 Tax=Spiroplasma endosymbiont of Danaus chrysippus TaxID=2691041 RepID=UPI00157B2C43|nr:hypothetical protein [Spiroplasma endosymbiont of Danaus chrysippus]
MQEINWWKLKKGRGIIVCISGDEHEGKQNRRPAIVLKTHPEFIRVQLLSTQSSNHDLGNVTINNKICYIRPIYLRNITINQIKGFWFDYEKRKPIQIDENSKLMKIIESNPYKAKSITLELNEYLKIKNNNVNQNKILKLKEENQQLKNEIELLKNSKGKNRNYG